MLPNTTYLSAAILLLLGAPRVVGAQDRPLTGIVLDGTTRRALAGVEVQVVETQRLTVTNGDGRFLIRVPSGRAVNIELRRLGYRRLRHTLKEGDADVRLMLSETAIGLDELVVTGTPAGTEKRALGTSVGRISARDVVEATSVNEMQQLLNGRVPGLVEMPASGNVGTGGLTRIRGIASMALPNRPLLYVDGVRVDNSERVGPNIRNGRQVSRINDINPEDIEHIEIIKGPAAATLYGTEASRGLIQIFTRSGTVGPPRFDFLIEHGNAWYMNAAERINYGYYKDPTTGILDSVNLVLQEELAGRPIFRVGHPLGYAGRIRGGTEMIRYYVSADVDRDEGVVSYNWRNRLSLRSNLEVLPTTKLNLKADVGFTRSNARFAGAAAPYGIMEQITLGSPQYTETRGFPRVTPEIAAQVQAHEKMDRIIGSIQIRHSPKNWFNQRFVVGGDLGDANSSIVFPRDANGVNGPFATLSEGDATVDRRKVTYTSFDYSASARYNAASNLELTTSVGAQYYAKHFYTTSLNGHGFPDASTTAIAAAASTQATEDEFENKTIGVYLQQQVSLNNRLYLTSAVRVDDNSAFGARFDVVTYPRVSLSWIVDEEPFWRFPLFGALRVRAALGTAGQQPDVYAAEKTYQPSAGIDGSTVTPQNYGNPDLKPECGQEFEIGFDAEFMRDRFAMSYTHYEQRNRDAIVNRPVAPSAGFPGFQFVNIGRVRNWGDELQLHTRVIQGEAFALNAGFTLSRNQNRIESMGGQPTFHFGNGQWLREGYPIGAYFGHRIVSAELDAAGHAINVMCDGGPANKRQALPCANAPELYMGQPVPKWEGAVHSNATLFKNLTLHALADFKTGHKAFDGDVGASVQSGESANARAAVLGTNAILKACNDTIPLLATAFPNFCRGLRGGGFAKLREVSATYTLPDKWTQSLHASRASITVSGRNLAILWIQQREVFGVKVVDPETRQGDETLELSNFVRNVIPQSTRITTTLRVTF